MAEPTDCGLEAALLRVRAARRAPATDEVAEKLGQVLDILADISYHEADLEPRVARAVRAAHRAAAKAKRAAG